MPDYGNDPLLGLRDIAAVCEIHPADYRRGCSTHIFPPFIRCKNDANQVRLNELMSRAADRGWALW